MDKDGRLAVIDGNRNFHPVMRGILRSLGFRRIEPFLEGAEASEHLRSTWCDLAFIDLTLSDGNGLDWITTLRRTRLSNRRMPIVVLTSATSRRNIEDAMAAGADYVMAKPVSPKSLADRIRYLKERPLDYIAMENGYYGPDPARFQWSPRPVLSDVLLRQASYTQLFPASQLPARDDPMDWVPERPATAYAAIREPQLIFLD